MHTYIHTCIRAYMHTYIHACMLALDGYMYVCTCIHACMHTCVCLSLCLILRVSYVCLDSSWRNSQIWLAISLGSKSRRPQVCFLDPMLSGNEKHLCNYCLFVQYLLSLYLQWNSLLHCFSNIFMGNRFSKIPACLRRPLNINSVVRVIVVNFSLLVFIVTMI